MQDNITRTSTHRTHRTEVSQPKLLPPPPTDQPTQQISQHKVFASGLSTMPPHCRVMRHFAVSSTLTTPPDSSETQQEARDMRCNGRKTVCRTLRRFVNDFLPLIND
ncbi:unnamed protein product [Ceratitis capitata]|uniref:(Mediterranean fruit fly) hypothetical protein n=1 Tax=Ceratitis capitata TaxID=7213 RepID=A0A811V4J3_CERCA|nr:unnamed protein product [Ceratitis capitata]